MDKAEMAGQKFCRPDDERAFLVNFTILYNNWPLDFVNLTILHLHLYLKHEVSKCHTKLKRFPGAMK